MMIKYETLAVIVKLDNGDCHQVALTGGQCNTVANVILQLHGGKISLLEEKLCLDISYNDRITEASE